MNIESFGNTHIGLVRSINEDAYGIFNDIPLYIVADGLGGHAGGEIASRIAVDTIKEYIYFALRTKAPAEIKQHILGAIKGANSRIIHEADKEPDLHGMGTTVVVAGIKGDKAIVAHVGDSRAYLVRDNHITQITKDHTVVEEYVRLGLLTLKDALYHPYRHVLSRALGISWDLDVDMSEIVIQTDDTLLLCTDGLTNMLSEREISSTIFELRPSPEKITDRLIHLAIENGGIDNITVITINIVE